jgi:hypothetical protein
MSSERRKSPRYQSLAKALIEGSDGQEFLLKDLSITGCRMESTNQADVETGARYEIKVFPEASSRIGKFELQMELMWVQNETNFTLYGLRILESPKGKFFQNYVDYLAWRSETGTNSHQ